MATGSMNYQEFFKQASGGMSPFPYQIRLAEQGWPDVMNVPTAYEPVEV